LVIHTYLCYFPLPLTVTPPLFKWLFTSLLAALTTVVNCNRITLLATSKHVQNGRLRD